MKLAFFLLALTLGVLSVDVTIKPFKLEVSEEALIDLKQRVSRTRLPDQFATGWEYGTNYVFLKELLQHWNTTYDWRAEEKKLNSYPQFTTEIEGLQIHFIHSKSKSPSTAFPLLFSHGWPGSFIECTKLLHYLNQERDGLSFDVVCPSIPGYGFSEHPKEPRFNASRIARVFSGLMERLGYDSYIAQGGDWGSLIAPLMAHQDPQHCKGVHVNLFMFSPNDRGIFAKAKLLMQLSSRWIGGKGYDWTWDQVKWALQDAGYMHIQATEPDTVAVGLNDSPAGLASYILTKYHRWSDLKGGKLEDIYTRDELLTFVHIYWFSESIGSSMRLYYEELQYIQDAQKEHGGLYIRQPCGYSQFEHEIQKHLRWEVELFFNLVYYAEVNQGGHFAALEEPKLLDQEIRNYFVAANLRGKSQEKEEL